MIAHPHDLSLSTNICDCYIRRPDQAKRVIGTLFGSVFPDGTVDIRNSYAVPHNESSNQVALDIDYHHNMLQSHLKVNPKEVIVGWFTEHDSNRDFNMQWFHDKRKYARKVEDFGVNLVLASYDDKEALRSMYKQEFIFCVQVNERLRSSDDYQAFLKCLHIYST